MRERGGLRLPGRTAMVTATGFCYSMPRVPFTKLRRGCYRRSQTTESFEAPTTDVRQGGILKIPTGHYSW
jgi:hypothetical protein